MKALFSQGLRDPISSLFVAGKPVAELGDAAPLSVLLYRAELIERGHPSAVSVPSTFRRNPSPRVALSLPLDDSEKEFEEALAVMTLDPSFSRDKSQRGLTCYFCYRTGHPWLECPYLQHLSSSEKEDIAYHRRAFYEKNA